MNNTLHIKYRPQTLDDVIGQDAVVKNLRSLFDAGRPARSYLFTGPSGTGKTTIARIIANTLGCNGQSVVEVDAARFSGIDAMRELLKGAQYGGLGETPTKFFIIDECHALGKAAWQTLLLSIEEPSEHVYWALCTTEAEKIPNTIRTRCHAYDLKLVKWDLLAEYLDFINQEEKLGVNRDYVDLAARRAMGSVRQGLVFLSMLEGITSREDAVRIVEEFESTEEGPISLARLLVSGKNLNWDTVRKQIEMLQDIAPETIRLTVLNYVATALMGEKDGKRAARLLNILQAFSSQCQQSEKMAPILLAAGTILMGGE